MAIKTASGSGLNNSLSSGLVLLNTTSFSGVSSVSLAQDTFTSTYDNYKILFSNFSCTGAPSINMRFRKAGVDNTTGGSYAIGGGAGAYSTTWSTFNTSSNVALLAIIPAASSNISFELNIFDPKINKATQFVTNSIHTTTANYVGGIHTVVDTYDALSVVATTGNIAGTYCVYGYNK